MIFQDFSLLSVCQVAADLTIAFACGFLISLLYRWTYRGPSYSSALASSLVALSMITAVVIMVIGNSLARAFGLVGALSIVRFRTAIRDMQDIVFIFFSLAAGIAAGVGLHTTAITGTMLIGTVVFVLSRTKYAYPKRRDFVLQFSFSLSEEGAPYLAVLERHCRRYQLVNLRSFGEGKELEVAFYVDLVDKDNSEKLVRDLGQVRGVNRVSLFFDEELP